MATAAATALQPDPLWYKDAVIYQLHIKSFFDSNNDGVGDFPGLIAKLDYIAELGVTAIWLLPFYPSPRRDDGYDIAEYRDVHPEYGTLADVRALHRGGACPRHARHHRAGDQSHLRPASLVPARPHAPAWLARPAIFTSGPTTTRNMPAPASSSCDTEKSNWTWDEEAKAYYWHRFYSHQPDLNFDNPRVLAGGAGGDALLARHGRRRPAAGRRALSGRARGHQQREPARDPCRS